MPLLEGDLEHYPRKFGKYHLLGPLAQGGMGALYLAVTGDRGLERLMVIKTVLPHLADAEYVARFRDEAKVVVKLSHGNLIPVFDAGLVQGELFLAMDFVEGRDLRAVWNRCAKKQVAFPIDVAVYIIKELCRGLAYAHSFPDLNLVHRDISPPNILVSYTGEVKLTDFGLAASSLKLEKTAPGIIYGKVAYMSPEQARGEKLDGRSDMYAAGIVLWELLTGRQLFPPGKDQPQDLLARAKNPEPLRPSKRAPRVSEDLDTICLRALAADKAERYADCDEMRMALQTWLAHNAPTTDGTRMSKFLEELFSEDIARERVERVELISRVRTRALTLPPTDELRRMIEQGQLPGNQFGASSDEESTDVTEVSGDGEAPVRRPGSIGRRASDRGDEARENDRRRESDRRNLRAQSQADQSFVSPSNGATALAEQQQPEFELDVGSDVDGRYRIIELIGEGGMGKVYMAEHVEIGKRVALKVLHPSYSRMPDLVERFRREARAASKIGHPNIVDVTDSGTTADGSVYFVMEYLEGVELGSVIEREGALDVARGLKIAGQICRALAAAHAVGIIHRDLKPENIYLIARGGEADVVKVLDFGIAKTTEAEAARERRLTSPGMAMGTPEYMAPEQAAGRPADARTDVYALGAIMYEMMTGLPPYEGDNFMEILTKKATQDPPPPLSIRPDLPIPVSDLVMAAMAREPSSRPESMEALEYQLNKSLAGRGVAVAQILGMTTDANVVASLNPGLSVRTIDDGIVRPVSSAGISVPSQPRAITNVSGVSPLSELTGYASGPALRPSTEGMQPVSAQPSSSPNIPLRTATAPMNAQSGPIEVGADTFGGYTGEAQLPRRSALGVFGWLLLAAILFGGVGALLYVAFGERGQAASLGSGAAVLPGSDLTLTPGGSAAPATPTGGSAGSSGVAPVVPRIVPPIDPTVVRPTVGSAAPIMESAQGSNHKTPSGPRTTAAHKPPVAESTEDPKGAPALIAQGKKLEAKGEYDMARGVYQKLEKLRGYAGQAEYLQAFAAFQQKDPAAIGLAQHAVENTQNATEKRQAQLLYGDALFQSTDFERAKVIYSGLLAQTPDEKTKVAIRRKINSCDVAIQKMLAQPKR